MISLIAVVGMDGAIGPKDGLPTFANKGEQNALMHRAQQVTSGGVIVIGSNTAKMMARDGIRIDLLGGEHQHAIWSRKHGVNPATFLYNLTATGKKVFICGGRTTFRVFTPFCENFFIWRADLSSEPDNVLDPILPNWQGQGLSPTVKNMRMQ